MVMRLTCCAALACMAASPALAIERLVSTQQTCQQLTTVIERDGDAIVRYPSDRTPGRLLFKRFVDNERQCDNFERTIPFRVPTRGTNACQLHHCIDRSLRPKGLFED